MCESLTPLSFAHTQFFLLGQYSNAAPGIYQHDIEDMMENLRYEIVSLENKCANIWYSRLIVLRVITLAPLAH